MTILFPTGFALYPPSLALSRFVFDSLILVSLLKSQDYFNINLEMLNVSVHLFASVGVGGTELTLLRWTWLGDSEIQHDHVC